MSIPCNVPAAFKQSQGPFVTEEFCTMLGTFTKVTKIGDAPVIFGHKTFYWADTIYPDVPLQFVMGDPEYTSPFFYFIQRPGTLSQRRARYHKRFREYALAALQKVDMSVERVTEEAEIRKLYDLYVETINRLGSVTFPYLFFKKILELSYAYAIIARVNNEPCACGIMLGNSLFIQASNEIGYKHSANYAVYDTMYSLYENDYIFTGVTIREGHTSFKYRSGATAYHVGVVDHTWYADLFGIPFIAKAYEFYLRHFAGNKIRGALLLPY